ncbi:MAG: CHAD domain-containing protein [Proteobacteria bacterium]|nr:CHAD domain-containing protein [Pseudomonadota bacterium]
MANQFLQIIAVQLSKLNAGRERLLLGQDAEALHDFRVALRSLRSLLPIVLKRSKRLDSRILAAWKALAQFTSPVRDAEVLLLLLAGRMSVVQQEELAKSHCEGLASINAALVGPDFAVLSQITLQQSRLRIKDCDPCFLKRRIKMQAKDYVKLIDKADKTKRPSLEEWHDRRLTIKRLRYLSLLAAKWLPQKINDLQLPLKKAQTAIGKLHDAELIAQFMHEKKLKKPFLENAKNAWCKLAGLNKTLR